MPAAVAVGTVLPAVYMRGSRETFGLYPGEPNFPRWVGGRAGGAPAACLPACLSILHVRMHACLRARLPPAPPTHAPTRAPTHPRCPRSFTAWLGQNSSAGKQKRLLGELHTRMVSSGALECDRTALRVSYLPVLRSALTRPLVTQVKGAGAGGGEGGGGAPVASQLPAARAGGGGPGAPAQRRALPLTCRTGF